MAEEEGENLVDQTSLTETEDSKRSEREQDSQLSKNKQTESMSMTDIEKDIYKLTISIKEEIPHDSRCPICQDRRLHPITLPCGHIFCYLCIKGVYARRKTCALCRQTIPPDSINQPSSDTLQEQITTVNKVCWMYQAKSGGWWLYEERISLELESSYQSGSSELEVQISGFVYTVDFLRMVQFRQEKPDRVRHIKRTISEGSDDGTSVRGVAGIPLAPPLTRTDDQFQ